MYNTLKVKLFNLIFMAKKKRDNKDIDFYTKIGEKIRNIRIEQNLTQKDIGNYLGISSQIIVAYEKGDINIPFYSIAKICEILDISLDYLVAEAGSMNEYIAKYKVDIEGFISAFSDLPSSESFGLDHTRDLLSHVFYYIEEDKNILLERFIIDSILEILIELKVDIPFFTKVLSDKKIHSFIIGELYKIYKSKDDKLINRLEWDVKLAFFIYRYSYYAKNLERARNPHLIGRELKEFEIRGPVITPISKDKNRLIKDEDHDTVGGISRKFSSIKYHEKTKTKKD